MKEYQKELVKAWQDYAAGKIDAKALKGASAPFGIYQQRDDLTMMRVRRPCGWLTIAQLKALANIARQHRAKFLHLTTRQDVQIHGVPATEVPNALEACEAAGFHFRGGGGDTFRNTLVSSFSGLHIDSVFDVSPYAFALARDFATFDLAYALPRKLKIAFADRPADHILAESNDLGFVARIVDNERVFETYLGGGMGFKPRLGMKIFDALNANDCIRAAKTITRLFNDHGCRTNRAHARIRFLREDFGDDKLKQMFMEYFEKEPSTTIDLPKRISQPNDLELMRIYVPFGNLTPDAADELADTLAPFVKDHLEVLPSLDLGLAVDKSEAATVRVALEKLKSDYTAKSFVGNIRTCVGCTICKNGITDAPAVGKAIAQHFDRLKNMLDAQQKQSVAQMLLNDLRISGCPNSCTAQQLAKFGFYGRLVNGEPCFVPNDGGEPIAADKLPNYLESALFK